MLRPCRCGDKRGDRRGDGARHMYRVARVYVKVMRRQCDGGADTSRDEEEQGSEEKLLHTWAGTTMRKMGRHENQMVDVPFPLRVLL